VKHETWRNALVTGASSGIGRALARELATNGVPVMLAARRCEMLERVRAEIEARGGRARVVQLDVADTERAVPALRALDQQVGGLDLVIANAGVGADPSAPAAYAWEAMRGALHTNLCGAAATLTAALPAMVARSRGHLVGIGSLASYGALPGAAAYCVPKAGLAMLLDCLRLDLVRSGVAVTHVRLGFVRTPMVEKSTHPMPQLLEADDVAMWVVRALRRRPREVVIPRTLAAATRVLAALPEAMREAIAARGRTGHDE
jgi:short-subunit dehydrogenase